MTNIGRPKQYQKSKVLETALNTFWKYGYANVSTQQLCEATHLGRGSLYHAFNNKHDLFLLSLRQYVEEGNRMQRECFIKHNSSKDGVNALLDWAISMDFNDSNISGCFMINSYLERGNIDSDVSEIMNFHIGELKQLLTEAFIKARKNKELRKSTQPIEEALTSFLIFYFGFRFMNTMPYETIDTARKRKRLIIEALFN
ncbi:TetR/AcrR family transcriptional regulator [Staphylococcus auricularis]|uniref:TetR/AcrR family transcriptional regulator n=1 Tax=Staphylococcus auricularis TaxID=29379 RepID=UPI00242FF230|nr:TetR/AcrR family transcriptional regulator [Staphylococcus auricularis]